MEGSGNFTHRKDRKIVMTAFLGVYECTADAKGRLMLPVAFKKQVQTVADKGFVLKRSVFQKCLELYSMDEWEKVMAGINQLNRFNKKNMDFIRMFNAGVKQVELDSSGRLLLTKDLMEFAGISKDVVLASAVSMIEIWDKDKYEASVNDPNVDFGSLAEEVMGNGGE